MVRKQWYKFTMVVLEALPNLTPQGDVVAPSPITLRVLVSKNLTKRVR